MTPKTSKEPDVGRLTLRRYRQWLVTVLALQGFLFVGLGVGVAERNWGAIGALPVVIALMWLVLLSACRPDPFWLKNNEKAIRKKAERYEREARETLEAMRGH